MSGTTARVPSAETWLSIDWATANREVQRLQQRIFRATQREQWRTVRNLQKLLLRSDSNLVLAVRQVTQVNDGRNTPGVDGRTATTSHERGALLGHLRQTRLTGSRPVRRVYIPKATGKLRPLGIPTIEDRVRQAVVKTALEPAWEARFEAESYGFRPGRSTHDAIQRLYTRLHRGASGRWVLDADIRAAFDTLSHAYILSRLQGFPARRQIARWLTAGYLEQGRFFTTDAGTPQGGIASPLLANIALDGLGEVLNPPQSTQRGEPLKRQRPLFGYVRYADDFVVAAPEREHLERVIPVIRVWLAERGRELNEEKTRIVRIDAGFDFLGCTLRHFDGHLLIRPQKSKVLAKLRDIRRWLHRHRADKPENIVRNLNPIINGWGEYYRHANSSAVYTYCDHRLFRMLWTWARRRHPHKTTKWIKARYFPSYGKEQWRCNVRATDRQGRDIRVPIAHARRHVRQHTLVVGKSSPMDPALSAYWSRRWQLQGRTRYGKDFADRAVGTQQDWQCLVCHQPLVNEPADLHHVVRVRDGGSDKATNLRFVHAACHDTLHARERNHDERLQREPDEATSLTSGSGRRERP